MKNYKLPVLALAAASVFMFTGCDPDDDDPINELEVPSTYVFERNGSSSVAYTGQTNRGDMLAQLTTKMKTANTLGNAPLDAQELLNMFRNENSPFPVTYTQKLSDKCFQNDVEMFEGWLTELAANSAVQQTASDGNAGVLVEGNSDPTTGYIVNDKGIELIQLVEKGLMGAVFYFQAMEAYLTSERMGTTGNDDVVEGQNYTNQEHWFDEAFGYFGATVDFPASPADDRYWAKYANSRSSGLYPGINEELSLAFRTARAAITAKDYEARDEAIRDIQEKWAIVSAGTAVDYLSQSLSSTGIATYRKHHALSEYIAFSMALKYHFNGGNSKFPPFYNYAKIQEALAIIGPETNLYQVGDAEINQAIAKIKEAFPAGVIK
jgi:hypothetical protein